ncbi:hypothetical protein [Streptomyces sp. NBRC 110028]|uniref:hypothetical protein n=1 Tax=Streptomyces sp. NBRC 110028 TaxID=1621260 RepID=UPI00131C4A29|nr:hypothetical protein [Streptomyces sp. NBRC 110028]
MEIDDRFQTAESYGEGPAGGRAVGVAAVGDDLAGTGVEGHVLVDRSDTGIALVGSGRGQVHGADHGGDLCTAEGAGVDCEVEVVAAEDVAG